MAKFIFNRYHLQPTQKASDKLQFILDGLITKSATSYRKYAYKLVEVEFKDNFIYGYLIKYDPYSIDEVYDEKNAKVGIDTMRNKIVAKSYFVIDYKESILIFEEVPNHISKQTFTDRFKELFSANHEEKGKVYIDISPIVDRYTFLNKVENLKKIDKIIMNLVPSNPRFSDQWKTIDERLRENNITKYKEIQENKNDEGIKIDNETKSKILMSEDGYGDTKVTGIDQNNIPVTLSTDNKERTVSLDVPRNIIDLGIVAFINFVDKTYKRIKDRTKNE